MSLLTTTPRNTIINRVTDLGRKRENAVSTNERFRRGSSTTARYEPESSISQRKLRCYFFLAILNWGVFFFQLAAYPGTIHRPLQLWTLPGYVRQL